MRRDDRQASIHFAVMKYFAALLIAAVFASAVMAEAPAKPGQGIRDALVAKAKELQAKINEAIKAGKGKAEEVAKQLGQKREEALVKLNELKAQLDAKLKDVVVPAVAGARQKAALKLKEQLQKAIQRLEAAKAKLEKLQ